MNAATVTPARTSAPVPPWRATGVTEQVGERDRRPALRRTQPGGSNSPPAAAGMNAITSVAPAPAPSETPSRYRVRQRVTEGALVRGAGNGQPRPPTRAERDAWGANLPADRAL